MRKGLDADDVRVSNWNVRGTQRASNSLMKEHECKSDLKSERGKALLLVYVNSSPNGLKRPPSGTLLITQSGSPSTPT